MYCDLCGNQYDEKKMVYVHCGSYICHSCILSEAAKLKELDRNWSEMVVHSITEELVKAGVELPKTHGEGLSPEQFAIIIRNLAKINGCTPSYEIQTINDSTVKGGEHYRVTHIKTDSRVATCYLKEDAEHVCRALNKMGGAPWS